VGESEFWYGLRDGVILALVYGLLGILLTMLGFKVFDWITPKIDIQRELAEKQNVAVAIICSAVIVGICIVVAVAIR
jgi:putative membrane protein